MKKVVLINMDVNKKLENFALFVLKFVNIRSSVAENGILDLRTYDGTNLVSLLVKYDEKDNILDFIKGHDDVEVRSIDTYDAIDVMETLYENKPLIGAKENVVYFGHTINEVEEDLFSYSEME